MRLRSKSSIYNIQKVLSDNGRTTVCMAYRKNSDYPWVRQKVLLKIFTNLSPAYPLELDSLLQIRSPYCITVLSFEKIENRPALILEWVDGINLFQLIRQSKPLNPFEISLICLRIQQGLMDLNKQGLVHGDLSLSNVLIDRKGHIRLIDFGKANYLGSNISYTPGFTAPEILRGEKPSFESDLFSLGILEKTLENINTTKDSSKKGDPLLDPLPQNRRIKEFIYYKQAKDTLAKKVNSILNQETFKEFKQTTSFNQPSKESRTSFIAFCLGLLMFSFISSGMLQAPNFGSINIRSHQWLYIEISNKSGFTPFESGPLQPGNYQLFWKSNNAKGKKIITIEENSHLLLTPEDLK
ncbi:MAG: protein kinase [Bdellovibrionales bacterium]|nr:protein kinase [Bdellovibrionales bacterium]